MKIVLSRLDRLGDLILSTPAIRALRRSFPSAHITLVCSQRNRVAVELNPDIDEIIALSDDQEWFGLARTFHRVELAIALAPRTQDLLFIAATLAKRRLGYTYIRRYAARALAQVCLTEKLVSSADPALCDAHPDWSVTHEIDQLLQLARLAGASIEDPELVLPLSAQDRSRVASYPSGAIHLHLAPRWLSAGSSEESVLMLLQDLRIWNRPIVVSYADECRETAERIRTLNIVDAIVGQLEFGSWAALIERASCVVTVDTSATHVASAMGRPVVVLFEYAYYALNAREWAPWRVPAIPVRKPKTTNEETLAASRQELVAAVGRLL